MGRSSKGAEKRLEARQKKFDGMTVAQKSDRKRPGSLKK